MAISETNPDQQKIETFLKRFQGDTKKSDVPVGKNELQKDDFTKLMLTQLKYQDPLNPMDNQEMGKQMAQMANIEQLQNLNAGMNSLRQDQKPMGRMNLVGLIGQVVEADFGRVDHAKGSKEQLSFTPPPNSVDGEFEVVNGAGETVFKKKVPVEGVESYDFKWDGKLENGKVADTGTYMVRAKFSDGKGTEIAYKNSSKGKVAGLDFRGDKSILILENGNKVDFSQVKSVGGMLSGEGQVSQIAEELPLDPTKPMAMVNGEWKNISGPGDAKKSEVVAIDAKKIGYGL